MRSIGQSVQKLLSGNRDRHTDAGGKKIKWMKLDNRINGN